MKIKIRNKESVSASIEDLKNQLKNNTEITLHDISETLHILSDMITDNNILIAEWESAKTYDPTNIEEFEKYIADAQYKNEIYREAKMVLAQFEIDKKPVPWLL